MRTAPVGLTAVYAVLPGPEACASAIGNDGVDVVSSPWLVGLLEEASHRVVRDLFEPGEGSVGVRLDLSHRAPALPGREVTAHARLAAVEGRKLRFEVAAFQGAVQLMDGVHERVLVDLDRFMATVRGADGAQLEDLAARRARTEGSPIKFYFDFHSPWCWFASLRIEALAARVRRPVNWRPIHLARLIDTIDGRRPLDANAAFVDWFKQDMQDTAKQLGVTLRYHPRFPLRPARALRASVHAAQRGRAGAFVQAVMRAYWSDSEDIEDADLLATIGVRCGLVAEAVAAAVSDESCKRAVEE
ncbi:MAG: thioesterase, FlK family, partial [Burkholderiaceae bacterium]